ncbi:unnamed protein product, partial [Mesorhabditis spiculigera]
MAHNAAGAADLQARHDQWKRRGADVELLTGSKCQEYCGTDQISSALLDRRAGTINPMGYTTGLAQSVEQLGGRVFQNSAVTHLEKQSSAWLVKTANGVVVADKIVISTGAYTEGDWSELQKNYFRGYYYQVASKPLEGPEADNVLRHGQGSWDTRLLHRALGQYVNDDEINQIVQFADQFYSFAALEELKERRISDLAGATISSWRMLMQHDAKTQAVRAYNPDFERHGWQSPHTVVEMVCPQTPFLINSIRMELNNRGYNIHTLQTAVFCLELDKTGKAVGLSTQPSDVCGSSKTVVAFFEIDRCSSSSELRLIEAALVEVLEEVRLVDADLVPMKAKINELRGSLGRFDPNAQASEVFFYSHGQSVRDIPCIRLKVAQVEERSGYGAESHLGQELARILEALPRDDLYQSTVDELLPTVISIAQIQERFKVRAFFELIHMTVFSIA